MQLRSIRMETECDSSSDDEAAQHAKLENAICYPSQLLEWLQLSMIAIMIGMASPMMMTKVMLILIFNQYSQ